MARPRQTATGGRRAGKLPRLTEKGKLLNPQEVANRINAWIDDEFAEELRLTAFLDVNTRRQIRLATGVGDIDTFVNEFNNGFANTSQLATNSEVKGTPGNQAFGEAWTDRPRLRKISREFRITFRPKNKGGS